MPGLAFLLLVGISLATSVVACRRDEAPIVRLPQEAGPAAPQLKRLRIDRLPDVVVPVQGELLSFVALEDGGYLALDTEPHRTLRRYTPAMSQLWETRFDGGRATFLDFEVIGSQLWVLVNYETDLVVDGLSIDALGNDWLNHEVLLVRLDMGTGKRLALERIAGRARVSDADLYAWADGAYLVADSGAAEPGEPDFDRVSRPGDPPGGVLIARLASDGSYVWVHRVPADNQVPPRLGVSQGVIALVSDAVSPFEFAGRTLAFDGYSRSWAASFDHNGNVLSLDPLPEMQEIVSARVVDAASELYAIGGPRLLLAKRNPGTDALRVQELECRRPYCYPVETWPIGDRFAVMVSTAGNVEVWIVSEELEVLAMQESASPIQNGYVHRAVPEGAEVFARDGARSERYQRWRVTIR